MYTLKKAFPIRLRVCLHFGHAGFLCLLTQSRKSKCLGHQAKPNVEEFTTLTTGGVVPLGDACIAMSGGSIPVMHFLVVISSTCMWVFLSFVPALQSCGLRLGSPWLPKNRLSSLQNVVPDKFVKNTRN